MTNHERFLDAMNGIDEGFLQTHIRKKCPTGADRAKRYAMAAGIYAAAIIAVAVILPFVIRHGEDPKPIPGDDPVVAESSADRTDEPEVRQIDVADIDAKYNGTDPEKQSDKVTLDEVKAIISAARQAYAEYDVIVLTDGTLLPTKAKLQDLDVELNELYEHERNTLFEEYDEYFNNVFTVIEEMLDIRFPDNSRYERDDPENYGLPGMYAMNLADTGFATAGELANAGDDVYAEWIMTDLMNAKTVHYFDSNSTEDETELLYPTAEEFEIWQAVAVWRAIKELPMTTHEVTTEPPEETTEPPTETTTTTAPPPPETTTTTTTTPPPETPITPIPETPTSPLPEAPTSPESEITTTKAVTTTLPPENPTPPKTIITFAPVTYPPVTTAAPLVPVGENAVHVHYGYNNPEGWDNISEPYSPRPKETYITFCNCVLKITIDKTNYLKSDTKAVVTVTLRNNGSQSVGLRQSLIYYGPPMEDKSHLIDDVKYSDGKSTIISFAEGYYAKYGLIQPYETITLTEEVDLSVFDYDAPWTVTATVHFIPEPTMDNRAFPTEADAAKVRTAVLEVELPHTDPPPVEYPSVEHETDMERYTLTLDKTHYTKGDVIDATMSLEKFEGYYDVLHPFHNDRYLLDYLEFYEDGVLKESYRIPYDNGFEIKDYYEFYRGDKVNFKALFSTENASPDSKWVIKAGFRIGMSFNLNYIELEVPHD